MTSTVGLVARFTAVGVAVLAGLAGLLAIAAREAGTDQATEAASQVAWVTAKGVVEPRLDAAVIEGDPHALVVREREVLRLVGEGLPNKSIARRLGITERTVKAHLTSVYQQLGVTDRTQAALWAQRQGQILGQTGHSAS